MVINHTIMLPFGKMFFCMMHIYIPVACVKEKHGCYIFLYRPTLHPDFYIQMKCNPNCLNNF
jgi:hypothetical protein